MITAVALRGVPEVVPGDDLGAMLADAAPGDLAAGDVVVVSQKVVSKAEGRIVRLADVAPSARAVELAETLGKDPRAVEVVLGETEDVVRAVRGVLIVRTHHGFVCANAGVDASNAAEDDTVILLPLDPDRSARTLRARLRDVNGAAPAVVITDSFGRAWRHGQVDIAIGCAGLSPLDDWRGRPDSSGRELRATWRSAAPGSCRSTTGPAAWTTRAGSCARPRSRWPTRPPPRRTWPARRTRASRRWWFAGWTVM